LDKKEIILPITEEFGVGDNVLLLISPNDIFVTLEAQKSSVRNMLEGRIMEMKFKKDIVRMAININGINVIADITELSRKELDLNLGKNVFIGFKAAAVDIIKRN